jgi:hypothetical protein
MYVLLNAFSHFKQNVIWLVLYSECQQEGICPEMYDFGPDNPRCADNTTNQSFLARNV